MKKIFILLIAVFSIMSCASGSYIVTGNTKEAISAENVKIYPKMPENAEIIGIVYAESDSGFTEQKSVEYAVSELKNQAAMLGANGIFIQTIGQRNEPMFVNGFFSSISVKTITATAFWTED